MPRMYKSRRLLFPENSNGHERPNFASPQTAVSGLARVGMQRCTLDGLTKFLRTHVPLVHRTFGSSWKHYRVKTMASISTNRRRCRAKQRPTIDRYPGMAYLQEAPSQAFRHTHEKGNLFLNKHVCFCYTVFGSWDRQRH